MDRDDLPDIPSFAANRDEAVASAPRGAVPSRGRSTGGSGSGAGLGVLGRLTLTLALVIAAVSCAWAWQLQQALDASLAAQSSLASRTADLEALLSDTDESVAQSSAALGAQLKVIDKETRRLEQRRRELDSRIDKLEKANKSQAGALKALNATANDSATKVQALTNDLGALKKIAGDLERLSSGAKQVQTNLERIADNVNKANLERAALNKRVAANEEWIESINAFRRQVNASINSLESSLRDVQASNSNPSMQ